ncbi:MAG: saccharopine dehydrogenase C-terminal domain-containing protein [Chitinophagales bacterium]
MKNILILGAGKSSAVLIEYLLTNAMKYKWMITLGDMDVVAAENKINGDPSGRAIYFNSQDEALRISSIQQSDIVISLLPAMLHFEIAKECVQYKKHFISASYVSDEMRSLDHDAKDAGVILLNEMGLDPGIDHMSGMQMIDEVKEKGGKIIAFESYTGGLIAPESDDNPWNYKFTWNPRNVVLAGQGTAKFLWDNHYKYIPYQKLFSRYDILKIEGYGEFEGYPNRDSLAYKSIYGLEDVTTLVRGTLRKRGFCDAWNVFVQLGMTDDSYLMEGVENFTWTDYTRSFLPSSSLTVKNNLVNYLQITHNIITEKIEWLGLFSEEKIFRADEMAIKTSPAQILQKLLEEKWKLQENDKDICVMLHLMEYQLEGKKYRLQSSMVATGVDNVHTAMAKTVGLPAAIAAKMILNGELTGAGVMIPVAKNIYEPVLKELETEHHIIFNEVPSEI